MMAEISENEYFKDLLGKDCNAWRKNKDGKNKKCKEAECKTTCQKIKNALEVAHDIRKFEIGLSWTRALYFWGFEVAIFAGYIALFKNASNGKIEILLFAFSLLGLFITIMYYLVSLGSKAWQENWENHIDMLEYGITGNLHKIAFKSKSSYSLSRANQYVILAIGIFWFILAVFSLFPSLMKGKWLTNNGNSSICSLVLIIVFYLLIIFVIVLLLKSKLGKNEDSKGIYKKRELPQSK